MNYKCTHFGEGFVDVEFTPKNLSKRTLGKIEKTISENINLTPYYDDEHFCATCKNPGLSHPESSFCFICGDDHWSVKSGVLSL
jgi:hypothetical protein